MEQNNVVRETNLHWQNNILLTFDYVNHSLPPIEN